MLRFKYSIDTFRFDSNDTEFSNIFINIFSIGYICGINNVIILNG